MKLTPLLSQSICMPPHPNKYIFVHLFRPNTKLFDSCLSLLTVTDTGGSPGHQTTACTGGTWALPLVMLDTVIGTTLTRGRSCTDSARTGSTPYLRTNLPIFNGEGGITLWRLGAMLFQRNKSIYNIFQMPPPKNDNSNNNK